MDQKTEIRSYVKRRIRLNIDLKQIFNELCGNAKATHIFFSKKFQHNCVSLDVNFNESLTNDVVSFEQLGPGTLLVVCFLGRRPLFHVSLFSTLKAQRPSSDCADAHACIC